MLRIRIYLSTFNDIAVSLLRLSSYEPKNKSYLYFIHFSFIIHVVQRTAKRTYKNISLDLLINFCVLKECILLHVTKSISSLC